MSKYKNLIKFLLVGVAGTLCFGCSSFYPRGYYTDYRILEILPNDNVLSGELNVSISSEVEGSFGVFPTLILFCDLSSVGEEHIQAVIDEYGESLERHKNAEEIKDVAAILYSQATWKVNLMTKLKGTCSISVKSETSGWALEWNDIDLSSLMWQLPHLLKDAEGEIIRERKTWKAVDNLYCRRIKLPVFFNRDHTYKVKVSIKSEDLNLSGWGFVISGDSYGSSPFEDAKSNDAGVSVRAKNISRQ